MKVTDTMDKHHQDDNIEQLIEQTRQLSQLMAKEQAAIEAHQSEEIIRINSQKNTLLETLVKTSANVLPALKENGDGSLQANEKIEALKKELASCLGQNQVNGKAIASASNQISALLDVLISTPNKIELYNADGKT